MANPETLTNPHDSLHTPLCVLLPAEKLGEHALVRHQSTNGISNSSLGDAWHYAELAIATGSHHHLKQAYTHLSDCDDSLMTRSRQQAHILDIYMPVFATRVMGLADPTPRSVQRRVENFLGTLIDSNGYCRDPEDGNTRGVIGELIALNLTDQGMPGSPREEASPITTCNHDSYRWDGYEKIPISVKYRARSKSADSRVYRLNLGKFLAFELGRERFQALVAMNEEFQWPNDAIREEAANAYTAHLLARNGTERLSDLERGYIQNLRFRLRSRLNGHGLTNPIRTH